mgnify:CR=1 FL=1
MDDAILQQVQQRAPGLAAIYHTGRDAVLRAHLRHRRPSRHRPRASGWYEPTSTTRRSPSVRARKARRAREAASR